MKRIVTAIAFALTSCASAPVAAQTLASTSCPTFAEIEDMLVDQAGEQVIIASVSNDGTAIMFWLNPKAETWTITETVGECTYVRSYGEGVALIPMGEMA